MSPLTIDAVAVGDALPTIAHDLTVTDVVLGAMAARDWRPMHHDPAFARDRSGVADVFLDTPTQAAWFERAVTDWTGPTGRLGRLVVRMRAPVVAGDAFVVAGRVTAVEVDPSGCGWVALDLDLTVAGAPRSLATARVAVPVGPDDNPWARTGAAWLT